MNRENAVEDYAVSLDIGNASVGWAAFTPNYRLMRAKGHELIGARLFEPASTAEERRMARTTRRRYSRRHWRLRMLDSMFDQALSEVDPSFLMRRKYSWVHPEDKNNEGHWFGGVLFDSNEQDKRFYEKYPTIYHLRKTLMEDDERHDIREVYLAIHHMMKYRGNFLTEGELAPSSVFDVEDLLKLLTEILQYADEDETGDDLELQADANGLTEALCTTKGSRSIRAKNAIRRCFLIRSTLRKTRKRSRSISTRPIMTRSASQSVILVCWKIMNAIFWTVSSDSTVPSL